MSYFDNYEFRCSALGKIISKSGKLTDGIKTYLDEVFVQEIYGIRKEAYGKALDKGKLCEEDGITMLQSTLLRGKLVLKNKERRRNGWIHGECDIDHSDTIFDIKNALDLYTFGNAKLTWEYEWQLVGYSWLWERKKAVLFYCLNNMPLEMVATEQISMFYKNRFKYVSQESENYLKECEELENAHNYDHIPIYKRFKHWNVEISESRFEQIKNSVLMAREYLSEKYKNHMEMVIRNAELMGIEIEK